MSQIQREPKPQEIRVGGTRLVTVSFAPWLKTGVTITGTPTVAEQTTAHLTLSAVTVQSAESVVDQHTDPASTVVSFYVSGHHATTDYEVKITAATSDSQSIPMLITLLSRP